MRQYLNQLVILSIEEKSIITTINRFDDVQVFTGTIVQNGKVLEPEGVFQRSSEIKIELADKKATHEFFDALYEQFISAIPEDETTN